MQELDYKKFSILVVDDEPDNREIFRLNFRREFKLEEASDAAEALEIIQQKEIAVIITDHRMPNMTGLELLQEIAIRSPKTVRIMLTAYTETDLLLKGINEGQIYRYIVKPWDLEEMRITMRRAIERYHLEAENDRLLEELCQVNAYLRQEVEHDWSKVVGADKGLKNVMENVARVAGGNTTVLLLGESGTGKELIARAIHQASPRRDKALVRVNCAAIPETLLESELFGVEKGAYTGAITSRKGRFELANGGTIFLDEVGEMTLSAQVKLLRILQEQELERLGGVKTIKIDTRVIAATNCNLEKAISAKEFRQDLYYRLSGFPIILPPLRRRLDDIADLASFFLKRYASASGRTVTNIAPEALEVLKSYPWPGNVRELENAVERATILSSGPTLVANDLAFLDSGRALAQLENVEDLEQYSQATPEVRPSSGEVPLPESLNRHEKDELVRAMESAGGSKAKAARLLGINRSTLYYRLKKHGLG